MRRWIVGLFAAWFAAMCTVALAESETDTDVRRLLEQSFTLKQIDEAVRRLDETETGLRERMRTLEAEIARQSALAAETRKRAARVIRAYYTGERQTAWDAILSSRSIGEALVMLEFVKRLLAYDQSRIEQAVKALARLNELHADLADKSAEAAFVKGELLKQRERMLLLEEALQRELARDPKAAETEKRMRELNRLWEECGKAKFRDYFAALSRSLRSAELIKRGQAAVKDLQVTFVWRDADVNAMLREADPLFNRFELAFRDGFMEAGGTDGDVAIRLKGRYTIEDQPKHAIRFRLDEVRFNDFPLDETTIRALETEHDLAIYPSGFDPSLSVRARSVEIEPGAMTVVLQFGLR